MLHAANQDDKDDIERQKLVLRADVSAGGKDEKCRSK
jgi:hypothetical protein